jgi:hypothetical protein
MAKCTVKLGHLFMVDVIEENRLVHRDPREDREEGIKDPKGRCLKPMISDDRKKADCEKNKQKTELSFHQLTFNPRREDDLPLMKEKNQSLKSTSPPNNKANGFG